MKRLSFTFETSVAFNGPVSDHAFVLRCLPQIGNGQTVDAHLSLDPAVPWTMQRDGFGNLLAVGNLSDEHDHFSYCTSGTAMVDEHLRQPCEAHPLYRFESKLTHMDENLHALFERVQSEATGAAGAQAKGGAEARSRGGAATIESCMRLMHAVHEALEYRPGATSVSTTAAEALALGAGVCQDFAHVLVALLRASGVPARYASGLTVGEGATHAWAQAHVDGRWVGLDPTRNAVADESYLVIATGRDWADCPVERGTFRGNVGQIQTVFMRVEEQ